MNQVMDTSRQALAKISNGGKKSMLDRIESIVADACRRGVRDMSATEIRDELEIQMGGRVRDGSLTGRINELITAGRLVRDPNYTRACSVTGQQIHPVKVLPTQTRAFY